MASRILLTQHLEDTAGNALSGVAVTVYASDGTTLVADTMYSAFTGGTTVANPVTTDASGNITVYFAAAGTDVPGDVVLSAAASTGTVTKRVYLYPHPDDISAATGRSYSDIRDYAGTPGGDVTTAIASANTALAATGGVIFIPQAATASTINSAVTLNPGVWLWGTGWNEGSGNSQSILSAGAAMTSMFTVTGAGCGIAFINLTDPAPLCTVDIIHVTAASFKLIESGVRATLASLPLITIGAGGRCRISGGRLVNADTTSASSTGVLFSSGSSDHFVGMGVTVQASLAISQTGGSNLQYGPAHFTGNAASTSNFTITAGQAICVNVQTDSCAGGAAVNVVPGAGNIAQLNFSSSRILNNNSSASFALISVDASALNSIALVSIDGCQGFAAVATPALAIVTITGTNTLVTITGGQWLGVSADWDIANKAPQKCDTSRATGSPNPTTFAVTNDFIGRIQGRQTADITRNNSTTATTLTGMQFHVNASEIWRFRFVSFYKSATGGPGPDAAFQITGPAAPTAILYALDNNYVTDLTKVHLAATAFSTKLFAVGAGTSTTVETAIEGVINNGATAGNVVLQGAQQTAVASDTVFLSNSYFEAWRLA